MDKTKLKKAMIFDCDGVLWDGIIGEGDVSLNFDTVADIQFLANRGVIVGLCSKNEEKDVLSWLEKSKVDKYISVYRINWNDKASNLKEIAQELNIGLDAMVFVDDSAFERGLVSELLPEVLTIHPKDITKTINEWFDLKGDFTKTQQYKENLSRARHAIEFTNIEDYLASLDMVLTIKVNDRTAIPRIAELTQKTNQFNLTTRRYDESAIEKMMAWCQIYTLSVKDKFGDNGLTGVCIINGSRIDIFLLSCRVLGRNIEYAFLDAVIKHQKSLGTQGLIAEYHPSERNQQTSTFYGNFGFDSLHISSEKVTFGLNLNNYKSVAPKYFRYEQ